MPCKRSETSVHGKLIQYSSSVPYSQVKTRLEVYIHKKHVLDSRIVTDPPRASSAQAVTNAIEGVTQGSDFLYFAEYAYHPFLRALQTESLGTVPALVSYTFGNPLIAQRILRCNPSAGLFVPLRLLLQERPQVLIGKVPVCTSNARIRVELDSEEQEAGGASISYYLPSSLVPTKALKADPTLEALLSDLDAKLERLVLAVLDEGPLQRSRL